MRAVIQRALRGSVVVEGEKVADAGPGLVILLGVGPNDTRQTAEAMAKKIAMMRIFGDDQGKMNLSVLDVGGAAVVVSQFTLYADTRKGHRPSFIEAAPHEQASALCDTFVEQLKGLGVPTQTGVFGAHMLVELINDGPVTIWLEM